MPKVSIIVPIFNVEKYLVECLDSLISQTLKDIEIICVNDGSTDNSLQIMQEYSQKDDRIKIIDKPNAGYGHSMNRGLESACGEYIGIVESDDFVKPEMFEKLYNLASSNNVEIVKSNWYKYYTKGDKKILCTKINKSQSNKVINAHSDSFILRLTPSVWSSIYKKDFLNENNIRFLETPGASYQDVSFSFKVFSLAKSVLLTSEAYLFYRQDNMSSSIKNKEKIYCMCDEFEELDRFLDEHSDIKSKLETYKLINEFNGYMWNLYRISPQFREEFVNKFSDIFKNYYNQNKINDEFFKKINRKKFMKVINHPEKFLRGLSSEILIETLKTLRKKFISIRLNSSGLNIAIMGRQIVNI